MRRGNSSSAVRSTNWRYHMIFISSSTRRYLRIPGVVLLTIETAPTPRIDPAGQVRMEQLSGAGGGSGNAGHDLGREPHKSRLNCRRTATASLFLGRNRTSDSTRIPVWISLEAGGRRIEVLPRWPQGANACGISCATVGLCSEARAEALSGKIFRCDGLIL